MIFDLKRFRKDYKLKQSELASVIGVNQSFISDIENGKAPLPEIHYDTLKEKYGEDLLKKYIISESTGSVNVKGNSNVANTGIVGGGINSGQDDILLDLFIPSEFNVRDIKDLPFDQFKIFLVHTLRKLKEEKEELEKKVIKLEGDIATRDATIEGLKKELAIRVEMITFLQNKK